MVGIFGCSKTGGYQFNNSAGFKSINVIGSLTAATKVDSLEQQYQ